jgi:hypothetical protein
MTIVVMSSAVNFEAPGISSRYLTASVSPPLASLIENCSEINK